MKIYMVNEYEDDCALSRYYLRSYLFSNKDEARKFIRNKKKENTRNSGSSVFELEVEELNSHLDYKEEK